MDDKATPVALHAETGDALFDNEQIDGLLVAGQWHGVVAGTVQVVQDDTETWWITASLSNPTSFDRGNQLGPHALWHPLYEVSGYRVVQ